MIQNYLDFAHFGCSQVSMGAVGGALLAAAYRPAGWIYSQALWPQRAK
jgi:hypothetical protein